MKGMITAIILAAFVAGAMPSYAATATFGTYSTATFSGYSAGHHEVMATCSDALFNPEYGVFADEGGHQNSKWDTGNFINGVNCGGTKYGIACAFNMPWLRSLGVPIKDITKAQAASRYEKNECAAIHIEKLKGRRNPAMLLGLAVNQGSGTAIINLKEVRNAIRRMHHQDPLPVNAVMDDDLIGWYNDFTADGDHRQQVLFAMSLLAIDRATDIVDTNPRQAANLMEWVTRWNPLNFKMPAKVKKSAAKRPAKKPLKKVAKR